MEPFELVVDAAGGGCVAVATHAFAAVGAADLELVIESALGAPVVIVGVRFVDGDGRDATKAVPGGTALVGFRRATPDA